MEANKIIITGGATRIGAAIAKSLSGPGVEIVIHFNKSKFKAEKLKKELSKNQTKVYLVKGDLSKETDVNKILKFAKLNGTVAVYAGQTAVSNWCSGSSTSNVYKTFYGELVYDGSSVTFNSYDSASNRDSGSSSTMTCSQSITFPDGQFDAGPSSLAARRRLIMMG